MSRARISAADVAAFQADGAVALRALLTTGEVELLVALSRGALPRCGAPDR